MMTLGNRLAIQGVVALSATIIVAAVAMFGIGHISSRLTASLDAYDRMRIAYEAGLAVATAKQQLDLPADDVNRSRMVQRLTRLRVQLANRDAGDFAAAADLPARLTPHLDQAIAVLERQEFRLGDEASVRDSLRNVLAEIATSLATTRGEIQQFEKQAQARRQLVYWVLGVTTLSVALLLLVLGRRHYATVMRPIHSLRRASRQLAQGRFDTRAQQVGDQELAQLARVFNNMAQQLETLYTDLQGQVRQHSAQLVQADRLASIGLLAAGVAHEVNNPMGVIAGQAELALRQLGQVADSGLDDETIRKLRQRFEGIRDEAFRCKQITTRLTSLATPASGKIESVDVAALARQVVDLLDAEAHRRGTTLTCTGVDVSAIIRSDANALKQVLMNLLLNSLAATESNHGTVTVALERLPDGVAVHVADNGVGMTEQRIKRVFEPMFTTKRGRREPASGLGLSVSWQLVHDLGGTLTAQSGGPGQGSRFSMVLPTDGPMSQSEDADES